MMSRRRSAMEARGQKALRETPENAGMDSLNMGALQGELPLQQNQHERDSPEWKALVKSRELASLRINPDHALTLCTDGSDRRVLRKKRKLEQIQNSDVSFKCKVLVKKLCESINPNLTDYHGSAGDSGDDNGSAGETDDDHASAGQSDEGQNSDSESTFNDSFDSKIMRVFQRKHQLKQNPHQEVGSDCKVLGKKCLNNEDEQKSIEKSNEQQNSHLESALNDSADSSNMRELRGKRLLEQIQLESVRLQSKVHVRKPRELSALRVNPDILLSIRMDSCNMGELQGMHQLEKPKHEVSSECKGLGKKSCESINLYNKDKKRSTEEADEEQDSHLETSANSRTRNVVSPSDSSSTNRDDEMNPSQKGELPKQIIGGKPVVMLSRLNLSVKPEVEQKIPDIEQKNPEESTDESDDAEDQQDLSAYERKRLKNIKENEKFLKSLELLKMASVLYPAKKTIKKRDKPEKTDSEVRRSKRLQKMDPTGVKIPDSLLNETPNTDLQPKETMKPPGPLPMAVTNRNDVQLVQSFLRTCSLSSQCPDTTIKLSCKDGVRYESQLKILKLRQCDVAKVVPDRIYSLAVHPTQPRFLVAAGDKTGHVGLYGVRHRPGEESVYTFAPHIGPVSTLHFSPSNCAQLLSLSYDGTVRCGDCNYFVFDEVYRDEEGGFSSFDFLTVNSSVLVVSHWDSLLSVVDRRTPGTTWEMQASVGMSRCRTVSVHPLRRELCLVAGARDVFVYDVRMLYSKKTQPVLTVPGHTRSVSSAYFSPQTGHRILTTCADDLIRIYNTNTLGKSVDLITKIRHNNHTGRWLTCFRAVWDPKQEGYFAVGSMERPRRIEVFNEKGHLVHPLWSEESLSSVCSVNAFHPVRNVIVGGNSSGRVHVFY